MIVRLAGDQDAAGFIVLAGQVVSGGGVSGGGAPQVLGGDLGAFGL